MRASRRVTTVLAWLLLATIVVTAALVAFFATNPGWGYTGLIVLAGGLGLALLLSAGILVSTAIQSLQHVRSLPPAAARRSPALWVWAFVVVVVLTTLALTWHALPWPGQAVGLLLAVGTLAPSLAMAAHACRRGPDFS